MFRHSYLLSVLRGVSFIKDNLNDQQLLDIASTLETLECQAGETVIREGDEGDAMYIIERGTLAVSSQAPNPRLLVVPRDACDPWSLLRFLDVFF